MKRKRSDNPYLPNERTLFSKRRKLVYFPRRNTAYAQASRALKLIRKFKKDEEEKYIDTQPSITLPFAADAWAFYLCNPLSQGTTPSTRLGAKVAFKSLLARLTITRDPTETNGLTTRFVILYDRKPAGAAPTATTIFLSDFINAPLNRANAGRFAILYDRIFNLDNSQFNVTWKIYLDLKRVSKGDYGLSNVGTIADISKGSIYMCAIGNQVEVADCNISGRCRVTYTDA